jgi:hypothetical protein
VKKLGDLVVIDKGVSYNGAGLTEDGNPMVNLKNILAGGGFRRDATKPYSGDFKAWAVPGFKDALLRCLMEPEVFDGATQEVF